ncbi:iron ABC transporter permease [Thermococcus sp. M39]|uniref:FecCD family ABC transporter permease n=1 Tax=unclassified Thermococcus TaxID=2627626 RepID=UPI00143B9FC8|nr:MULTISPECIES: iron ABC transporter permease [unclassified Thermococcus]NJE07109.1 iron ABC transporter permease [Thermococcus sp. M39]NJE13719.1 iron ABC transporter permease [Thermococcus sp. LS2]
MRRLLSLFLLVSPIFAFFISLCIGAYHIPLSAIVDMVTLKILQLISGILAKITFGKVNFTVQIPYPSVYQTILFKIRLPRVILAMIVGSALALSGAVLQAIFRNPLVNSYILGISAGAAFGAALAIGLSLSLGVTPLAFAFALLAVFLTTSLAKIGGRITPVSLVLAGVIVNAFFSALTSLLKFLMEHEKLASVVYWLMGSFADADWHSVKVAFPVILLGCALIYLMRWQLNVLSFGEEAKIVGVETEKLKFAFIIIISLITAVSVAFCGIIGWVGLMIPHIVRMAFGPDHKTLIPLTITVGASFMVLADTLARSIATYEIPIGILTTILGIPFFAYLLRKTGGGWNA